MDLPIIDPPAYLFDMLDPEQRAAVIARKSSTDETELSPELARKQVTMALLVHVIDLFKAHLNETTAAHNANTRTLSAKVKELRERVDALESKEKQHAT